MSLASSLASAANSFPVTNTNEILIENFWTNIKAKWGKVDLLNENDIENNRNQDYYAIIGVSKNASIEEIKTSYRKKAKDHHPDRHSVAEENIRSFHMRRFKELVEAKSVLADPGKRALYDQIKLDQSTQAQNSSQFGGRARLDFKFIIWAFKRGFFNLNARAYQAYQHHQMMKVGRRYHGH